GIVRVEASGSITEQGKEFTWTNTGTGFIIPGGYIVTNDHVLRSKPGSACNERIITGEFAFELPGSARLTATANIGAERPRPLAGPGNFEARTWFRRTAKLVVVGQDARCDLAVLKLEPLAATSMHSLADQAVRLMRLETYAVKFAAADSCDLGDAVVAI